MPASSAAAVRVLTRLEQRVAHWSRALAVFGALALLVIATMTMIDILLRWIANSPIKGLNDINALAAPLVIATCFPLVLASRQNIVIRFLGDAAGKSYSRWLEALGSAALLVFIALIGWQLVVYTVELARSSRTTWQLLIPVTPYWTVATGIVLLCIPIQAAALAADVACAIAGHDRPPEGEERGG